MNKVEMTHTLLNKTNNRLCVTVMGDSMQPIIQHNDLLVVEIDDKYSVGDVIVFSYEEEVLVHRILKISEDYYYCKGDNAFRLEKVKNTEVLGRVCELVRMGERMPLEKMDNRFIEMSYKIYRLYIKNMYDKEVVKASKIYCEYFDRYLKKENLPDE